VAAGPEADKTEVVADEREPPPSEIRVSDRDRDAAVERLRQNVTDGSLTLDEFADRMALAFEARTRGDLDRLQSDLPAPVADGRRSRARRWVLAVMSGSKAKGRWRVGRSVTAVAVMGGCELDFRGAEIEAAEVRVTAIAVMGGIEIVVPEGIAVELTGLPFMGGKHLRIADVPFLPGSPVISVRAFPIMGGVSVRSKPDRRSAPPRRHGKLPLVPTADPASGEEALEPGASGMPAVPDGTVTIMFSDIVGYSAMTQRLGDRAAHELLRAHNAILREQLSSHGGHEVKSQGDGFMVAFPSATRAVRCAIAIQKAFEKYAVEHPGEPILVHIGLHTGEPVRDGGDLLGRSVITASRLSGAAQPGEILVSSLLHELAEATGEFRFGRPRDVELKGINGAQVAYPVDWRT
jgi:class 3 adenylate cyclase